MQVMIEVTNPLAREQTMTKVQDKAKVIAIKELLEGDAEAGGMNGPATPTIAPGSWPSTPRSAPPSAVALRPALTAAARGAFEASGRDGETPFSRTEKLFPGSYAAKGEALSAFRAG